MSLKRPARVEWQDVGREQKRSRRLGKKKIQTLPSRKKLTRGGRSSRGGSKGKGRSLSIKPNKRAGGVVIKEIQAAQNENGDQDDGLMEVAVEACYEFESALPGRWWLALNSHKIVMIHLLWNYQGLDLNLTVQHLGTITRKYRPSIVFLIETKMKDNAINVIRQKLGYRNSFNFDPDGIAGGLSLWWNDDLDIQILSSSKNVIDTAIISRNGDCPKRDFNEILWGFEKSGGHETSLYRPQYLMNFMDKIGLIDLGFQGQSFTWRKNRSERGLVQEQLDRDLINCSWQEAWPNSTVTHCPAVGSDHCPLVIDSSPILKKHDSKEIVRKNWHEAIARRNWQIDKWCLGLKWCRKGLQKWSKEKFPNNNKCIWELMEALSKLQMDWEVNYPLIEPVKLELAKFGPMKRKDGESNTTFFHHSTIQRRRDNRICKLKLDSGIWVENEVDIRRTIDGHFHGLFTTGGHRELQHVLANIKRVDEEIDIATKEIGALKSLGPDGFQGLFYHTYWVLIRNEVRGAVHEFFRGEVALDKFNSTNIALIPKVPNPEVVSHFCPISCCNFSYKIFAKVLANRFKPILEQVITHHQSAFMPNRQIQDNVIMLMRFFIT
ncbi:unnamed protein product [Prunus armeniaca]|uniref:Uncharacterized protein n=1 Tax=Prunus armeniaca TaxID=36596 RepID=A0A6J5TKX0_PRUAR|nr:unnamed protein product [Prunus armeniaca]